MSNTAALLPLIAALSAGDISATRAALKTPDSQVVTTPGSPNDAFWTELARRGWMRAVPAPEGLAGMVKTFAITPAGRKQLPALLPARP